MDGWLRSHRERRQAGRKHPVEDFLFTYYSYRPNQLRRWHPGPGVICSGADPAEFGAEYRSAADGLSVDVEAILAKRGEAVVWMRALLTATASRTPHLGCFGMHEWAMVYRLPPGQIRHAGWPLRLNQHETAAVVDANRVRCSHFDAYRFFTEPARPLNLLRPTRANQIDLDQPGCLHANMDLYKWAYKGAPLVPSELIGDCFALAREIRALDMRASPYDLADLGYPPIQVETPEGRAEYAAAQRGFAERAAVLRRRLIDTFTAALDRPAVPVS